MPGCFSNPSMSALAPDKSLVSHNELLELASNRIIQYLFGASRVISCAAGLRLDSGIQQPAE